MKSLSKILVGALLFAAASMASATYCTNGATNYPACDNVKPPAVTPPPGKTPTVVTSPSTSTSSATAAPSDSRAAAAAGAQAGAAARSGDVSGSNSAAGGAGGAGGSSGITDTSQSTSRSYGLALALPNPIQLASMAGVNCPTPEIKQDSNYWLWGAHAGASASTNTDSCVLMNGYAAYLSMCQFGNANKLLGMLMSSKLKGFEPEGADLPNMGPDECARFKNQSILQVAPPQPLPAPTALLSSSAANQVAPLAPTCGKGQLLSPGGRCYTPPAARKPARKPAAAVLPPSTCKVSLPCRNTIL